MAYSSGEVLKNIENENILNFFFCYNFIIIAMSIILYDDNKNTLIVIRCQILLLKQQILCILVTTWILSLNNVN